MARASVRSAHSRRVLTRALVVASLALAGRPLPCAAQTYDPNTGVMEFPGSPLSPTSAAQCDALARQWSQLSQALENAHQRCLDAHQSETPDPRGVASGPVCSHPACQSLHSARMEVSKTSGERVQSCRAEVTQYQNRQQLERQQAERAQRQQQERAEAARQAAEQQIVLAQQAQDRRREAAEQMAEVLGQHADELREMVEARQNAELVPSELISASGEFTPASAVGDSPATEVLLDPATNVVKIGNPPADIARSWQVGLTRSEADGYHDAYVYIWQFHRHDSELCPDVPIGDGSVAREALYQETAIEHYQLSNGVVIQSNLEKRTGFLRCLSLGETSGYPKYRVFPYRAKTRGGAGGVRG